MKYVFSNHYSDFKRRSGDFFSGHFENLNYEASYNLLKVFVVLTGISSLYPILITEIDLWDGVIVEYAFQSDIPEIFGTWFYESGWPLVKFLYDLIYSFSSIASINPSWLVNFVMFLCLLLTGMEIYLICSKVYRVPIIYSLVGTLFYFLNPTLSLNLSSVFLMHSVFIYLCLLSSRLYLTGSNKVVALSVVLLLISFQHNSNPLLFLFFLVGAYLFASRKSFNKDALVLVGMAIVFVVFRKLFPAHGLYSGYNLLNLYNLFEVSVWDDYLPFYDYFFSGLAVAVFLIFVQRPNKTFPLLFFAIAILLNVVPYVVVGKAPNLVDMNSSNGWSYRFAINFFLAVSVVIPIILWFCVRYANRVTVMLVIFILFMSIHGWSQSLYFSYASKARAVIYQSYFVNTLSNQIELSPGNIYIQHGSHHPSFYETNFYLYQALGDAKWMTLPNENIQELGVTYSYQKYRDKYILSKYERICDTKLYVEDEISQISRQALFASLFTKEYEDGIPRVAMTIEKEELRCL